MPLFAKIIFGALAIFTVCMVVRAMRTGRIYSRDVQFDLSDQPIRFSLVLAVQLMIVAFCVWCAAGYDPTVFFETLGIPTD